MPKPQDERMEKFFENCFADVLAQLEGQENRTIPGHEQYTLFRNAVKKFTTPDMPEGLIIKMTLHLMGMMDKAEEDGVCVRGEEGSFAINVATGEAIQVPIDYAHRMGGKHIKEIAATGIPPVVYGVPPRMPEAEEDPMAMD